MTSAPWFVREHVASVYNDGETELVEPGRALVEAGDRLFAEQGDGRRAMADGALFLYYASARYGLRGSHLAQVLIPTDPPFRNVIGKYVDAKTALVFRNQVKTYFLTEGGKVEEREKAEGMTQAVEAQFEASGVYGIDGLRICQDGQLFDGGVMKTVADTMNNRVINDRVFPWEIFIPLEEARTGKASQFFHRMLVDRSVLAGMFPDHHDAIRSAPAAPDDWLLVNSTLHQTADLVAVWEAWHLPSTYVDQDDPKVWGRDKNGNFTNKVDPGHDGRHAIALADGETLLDEPWVYDHPPLAFYLPQPDPMGPWSLSLAETLGGIQLELIKLGKRIQSIINLHGRPLLGVDRRARVNTAKITNDHADMIEVNGSPNQAMQYIQPGSVPSDVFRREMELDEEAGRRSGMNDMSTYGQKPAGVNHEPGMQMLADNESMRQTPAHRAWERFNVQLGINNVDAFRILAEHNPKFSLMFGDAENLKEIVWKDVDLGRGKYKYRAWPTNLLPSTPAAKTSMVITMLQGGLFEDTPAANKARALLPFPDMKAAQGDGNQRERNVLKLLDTVEQQGMSIDTMPEPWNDPSLCMQLADTRINKLQADGADDDRIDALRTFYDSARRLGLQLQAENVQAAAGIVPGQAPPGPGPQGPPPLGPPGVPAAA